MGGGGGGQGPCTLPPSAACFALLSTLSLFHVVCVRAGEGGLCLRAFGIYNSAPRGCECVAQAPREPRPAPPPNNIVLADSSKHNCQLESARSFVFSTAWQCNPVINGRARGRTCGRRPLGGEGAAKGCNMPFGCAWGVGGPLQRPVSTLEPLTPERDIRQEASIRLHKHIWGAPGRVC